MFRQAATDTLSCIRLGISYHNCLGRSNHTRTGKYCSEGYLDMCRCVGLGSEGFVAQHLTQYMKWKLEIEGEKWGEIKLNN